MKKRIIYSSVLTALLSASSIALAGGPEIIPEPDYFSGMYLGGIGGVHHNTFQGNSQVVLTQPVAILGVFVEPGVLNSTSFSGGEFDGYGGIQGGFGQVFNHQFYAGVQGWGEWGSTSETQNQTVRIPFNSNIPIGSVEAPVFISPTASATSSTTMKISNDYGVAAKLGWVVAPRSMLYGKIGASWADIEVSNSLDVDAAATVTNVVGGPTLVSINTDLDTGTASSSQNKIGLLLGVGFEQFVYQDVVSINVEYTYVNYGHVNVTTNELDGVAQVASAVTTIPSNSSRLIDTEVNSNASTSVQVSSLMAGLNFYFGRNWL